MRSALAALALVGVLATATAQKPVRVCGEYTYYVPENVTLEQARQTALQRARVAGLAEAFNETVYQSNTTVVSNRGGESSTDLYSYGGSDARGEWIEDTEPPRCDVLYEEGMLVVRCKVCGMAREIRSAGIEVTSRVLRNGTEARFEADEFVSGDDMYLWFSAPVNGYASVYLLDREQQVVYCLLPYHAQPQKAVRVEQGREYLFFRKDRQQADYRQVDEYTLTAGRAVEWNEVYVIFSPHAYALPSSAAAASSTAAIRQMTFKDFSRWLTRARTKDADMTVNKHLIQIHSK